VIVTRTPPPSAEADNGNSPDGSGVTGRAGGTAKSKVVGEGGGEGGGEGDAVPIVAFGVGEPAGGDGGGGLLHATPAARARAMSAKPRRMSLRRSLVTACCGSDPPHDPSL
jgi:hypothetical protein